MADVAVIGQVARDLVLAVDELPGPGAGAPVTARLELLGGAANQAVGCRQLGRSAALVGVVGDDEAASVIIRQAGDDGLDTSAVVARGGAMTALYVDVVERGGTRRLLEHVPDGVRLTRDDVAAARDVLTAARAVLIQLGQPGPAVLEAARVATDGGTLVVLDGSFADASVREEVLARATVVRADAGEAAELLGRTVTGVPEALAAARRLLDAGPSLVALAVGQEANVLAWPGGHSVMPLLGGRRVDPTGGGDAFLAGLVTALLDGQDPETAGWWASAAAALTVGRLGGRPDLAVDRVAEAARRAR
ncbi:PfkB family carbohydrate kinase [Georgenia ruanii]|uniref:Carbohydrate kinase n=1 Tax=Georgenia ruanii TaxID=348442 RepID=A0A7J9UY73_9MICO|nr:PfkB family carbohydrate kinase [Georgenia ruanii]MPV89575.1 carbohydrate kinase [Georgenia ruanii]